MRTAVALRECQDQAAGRVRGLPVGARHLHVVTDARSLHRPDRTRPATADRPVRPFPGMDPAHSQQLIRSPFAATITKLSHRPHRLSPPRTHTQSTWWNHLAAETRARSERTPDFHRPARPKPLRIASASATRPSCRRFPGDGPQASESVTGQPTPRGSQSDPTAPSSRSRASGRQFRPRSGVEKNPDQPTVTGHPQDEAMPSPRPSILNRPQATPNRSLSNQHERPVARLRLSSDRPASVEHRHRRIRARLHVGLSTDPDPSREDARRQARPSLMRTRPDARREDARLRRPEAARPTSRTRGQALNDPIWTPPGLRSAATAPRNRTLQTAQAAQARSPPRPQPPTWREGKTPALIEQAATGPTRAS